MKTTKTINRFMLAALTVAMAINVTVAQEATKNISKNFQVSKDAAFSVNNKFGKIHCNSWDKNEITIDVAITAKGRDTKEAERMIESVTIDIQGNASKVEATTSMSEKSKKDDKTSISIDYTINMPRTLKLALSNKFGDIYLDENTAASVINLDYGSLQINSLKGTDHNLNMRFSKGNLNNAETLKCDISYSELNIKDVNELVIDSRFSTIEVENADNITHNSQYDTSNLGNLYFINTDAKFSTIKIDMVKHQLELDTRYGSCTVKEVGLQFKEIVIDNSFGNVGLNFNSESGFELNGNSKFGNVSFPKNSNVQVEETSFTSKTYSGVVGKGSKSGSKVSVSTSNGDVNLKIK